MGSYKEGSQLPRRAATDRAMDDLWRRTLEQIPTTFGRLVYLSSLRDDNTGRYQHFGLERLYSPDACDEVLRASHEQVFAAWLGLPLKEKRSDLEAYLAAVSDDPEPVLKTWGTLNPYLAMIPGGAGDAERFLYVSDLEIILELLRNELSG